MSLREVDPTKGQSYGIINGVELARRVSHIYAGRDWHGLTEAERGLVCELEGAGYIKENIPPTGYVGTAV